MSLVARYVLYATGVLCSHNNEQEKAELIQYLHEGFFLVIQEKISINTLQIIYTEIGSVIFVDSKKQSLIPSSLFRSDVQFQEQLLTVLRDSLTNTNPDIRCFVIRLFHVNR